MVRRALLTACGLTFCIGIARAQSAPPGGQTTRGDPASPVASFGATARVRSEPAAAHALDEHENAILKHSLGDSFNAAEALPGTVPVFSGVPYLLVRGSPPAGTVQYYDDVPVPALFHLALGPEITHPSLIGGLSFHPGVAPARYGRRTGGVLLARGPRPPERARGAELEARLLVAPALIRLREPGLALHARYGYPGALLDAVDSSAVLEYWDYLARADYALDERDTITLFALGARDHVGDRLEPDDDIDLQFHRVLARLARTLPGISAGAQVYAGYERGSLGADLSADLHTARACASGSTWKPRSPTCTTSRATKPR